MLIVNSTCLRQSRVLILGTVCVCVWGGDGVGLGHQESPHTHLSQQAGDPEKLTAHVCLKNSIIHPEGVITDLKGKNGRLVLLSWA